MSPARGGFILVEASVVYTILTLALVALVPLFILCWRASRSTEHIVLETQLSAQLLEEIRLRKWDEASPAPARAAEPPSALLGPDAGESPGDKRSFDDIDDFDGWAESPPADPMMSPFGALAGYSRHVAVSYVSPTTPDEASREPTDYKRLTVCTRSREASPVCLSTLLTNR